MRRILHVVEAIETGVIRHVIDVVSGVDAEHHVALPARRVGGMTDDVAVARLRMHATPHVVDMRRSTLSARNLAAIAGVRRLIRELSPTVVHGHSTVGGAVARLAAVGTAIPTVYTPNGISPRRAARMAERLLAPATTALVAVSRSEADAAGAAGMAARRRIAVVANGIDPEPPPPACPTLRSRLGLSSGAPLVGTVGRLTAQKDPDTMLAAWERVAIENPRTHFVWIGDGDRGADARARAAASPHADRLHLVGHVPDAAASIGEFDVFVLASMFEGGPYAPLEAMRAGVPVVATDVVGTRDCLIDGRTGVLVPPGDPGALADAIRMVLADPERMRPVTERALESVASTFSVREMARRLTEVYDGVLTADVNPRP